MDKSALLTGFWTDFTSSVWNFCRWVTDVPPRETSPSAKSEEKWMLSQASYISMFWRILQKVIKGSFEWQLVFCYSCTCTYETWKQCQWIMSQATLNLSLCMKSWSMTIQMKPHVLYGQYFPVVLFIMLYKVVLNLTLCMKSLSVTIHNESYCGTLLQ